MSKIGTENFSINEFNAMCTDFSGKIVGLIQLFRDDFSKCADKDVLEIVDIVIDFLKNLLAFQCSLNEVQLSCKLKYYENVISHKTSYQLITRF